MPIPSILKDTEPSAGVRALSRTYTQTYSGE